VVAIDDVAERIERDVLGESHTERESPRVDAERAANLVKCDAEERAVADMDREPCRPPVGTARQSLAENGDIRVVAPQKPLVDRLLKRPDERSDGTSSGASQAPAHVCVLPR
jgi:hypothetical protein